MVFLKGEQMKPFIKQIKDSRFCYCVKLVCEMFKCSKLILLKIITCCTTSIASSNTKLYNLGLVTESVAFKKYQLNFMGYSRDTHNVLAGKSLGFMYYGLTKALRLNYGRNVLI